MGAGEGGQATALVVDAEVTSYLMMGALSPGLKRHSVTLFEGAHLLSSMCLVMQASSVTFCTVYTLISAVHRQLCAAAVAPWTSDTVPSSACRDDLCSCYSP